MIKAINETQGNDYININIKIYNSGNIFLCVLSIIFNIATIKIYLVFKYLRSIIYDLFFFISVNEIVNCCFHIFQITIISINIEYSNNLFFKLLAVIIYFTDTTSILLLACLCQAINSQILKQNRRALNKNYYLILSLFISTILTLAYYLLFLFLTSQKAVDFYTKVISFIFINNSNDFGLSSDDIKLFRYLIMMTLGIYLIIILFSFYEIIQIDIFIKQKNSDEQSEINIRKLTSFRKKIHKYPLVGLILFIPLISYSLIEIFMKTDIQEDEETIDKNKIIFKLFFYYLNSFVASGRSILFFKLFFSNEKIKNYIMNKLKNSDIFISIDQIQRRLNYLNIKNDLIDSSLDLKSSTNSSNSECNALMKFNEDASELENSTQYKIEKNN